MGKDLRGNPTTAWRRSPSPRGEAFGDGEGFGVGVRVDWKVEPHHHLAVVPLPFQGRLLRVGKVWVLR